MPCFRAGTSKTLRPGCRDTFWPQRRTRSNTSMRFTKALPTPPSFGNRTASNHTPMSWRRAGHWRVNRPTRLINWKRRFGKRMLCSCIPASNLCFARCIPAIGFKPCSKPWVSAEQVVKTGRAKTIMWKRTLVPSRARKQARGSPARKQGDVLMPCANAPLRSRF